MSLKSHLLTRGKATGTGIAGRKKRKKKANIFSTYSLGINPKEELTVSLASIYSLATAPT